MIAAIWRFISQTLRGMWLALGALVSVAAVSVILDGRGDWLTWAMLVIGPLIVVDATAMMRAMRRDA